MKMRKRFLFGSVMISAAFVVLLSSIVSAGYPGPDSDTDYDFDSYGWGCHARSYVIAWYSDPETYTYEQYFSSRVSGSAENYGPMYYAWFQDGNFDQGYTYSDSKPGSSGIDCTLVATYTVAYFIKDLTIDTCEALAYREIY
jgi:hypothetical protein